MSTLDDNAKEIPQEVAQEDTETASPEEEIKQPGGGSGGPVILFFMLGLAASLISG